MVKQAVYADGDEIASLRSAARQNRVTVNIGFTEKARYSTATLFNSNLIIGEDGDVLVHHRKLMPTWTEKLTWSPGDGHGLRIAQTNKGRIGALICGENTNPLARYSLMAQGEQVHISTWPPVWPTRIASKSGSAPTAPNYDNVAANRTRAAGHCFEAKCFGIASSCHLSEENIATVVSYVEEPESVAEVLRQSSQAPSMFLTPSGATLPGFTIDEQTGQQSTRGLLKDEENILYADMDLAQCIEGKQYHDVVGGYQRFDVFDLKVNRTRNVPVQFTETKPPSEVGQSSDINDDTSPPSKTTKATGSMSLRML